MVQIFPQHRKVSNADSHIRTTRRKRQRAFISPFFLFSMSFAVAVGYIFFGQTDQKNFERIAYIGNTPKMLAESRVLKHWPSGVLRTKF